MRTPAYEKKIAAVEDRLSKKIDQVEGYGLDRAASALRNTNQLHRRLDHLFWVICFLTVGFAVLVWKAVVK